MAPRPVSGPSPKKVIGGLLVAFLAALACGAALVALSINVLPAVESPLDLYLRTGLVAGLTLSVLWTALFIAQRATSTKTPTARPPQYALPEEEVPMVLFADDEITLISAQPRRSSPRHYLRDKLQIGSRPRAGSPRTSDRTGRPTAPIRVAMPSRRNSPPPIG
ncbi:MAG: hypothetical protein ACI9MC_000616 [Kiritimatiellia bacterium]|jgi:hypothetical protein